MTFDSVKISTFSLLEWMISNSTQMETAIELLLPSWWEVQVTVAAAAFVVLAYWFFSVSGLAHDRHLADAHGSDFIDDRDKVIFVLLFDCFQFFFFGELRGFNLIPIQYLL